MTVIAIASVIFVSVFVSLYFDETPLDKEFDDSLKLHTDNAKGEKI